MNQSSTAEPWYEKHPAWAGIVAVIAAFLSVAIILGTVILTTGG